MSMPTIAVINFSSRTDTEVLAAIRAVNRQVQEDFLPLWGQGRHLRLFNASFAQSLDPKELALEQVPAEAVIYLVDKSTLQGALGYHDLNASEMPFGFVFALDDDWTITLSHEVLELIVDPNVNAFIPGPNPRRPEDSKSWVLHTYEACDAVERFSYSIDGISVSDFVTPQYFGVGDAKGTRNDFLGVGVRSFSAGKDCHIAYLDPATWEFEMFFGQAASAAPALRRRPGVERNKPRRPEDAELSAVLEATRRELKGVRSQPLTTVAGITRTGRYRATAAALRPAKP